MMFIQLVKHNIGSLIIFESLVFVWNIFLGAIFPFFFCHCFHALV